MSFRNHYQLDQSALAVMQKAYDVALVQLGADGDDPRSGPLAAAITRLVDEGERDPNVLCALALQTLGAAGHSTSQQS